jgi:hypothetical protein
LAEYIASCLEHVESVEIYSCEDGDDNFHVKTRRQITLGQLKSPRFHFMPNQLTTIYRDRAELRRHATHRIRAAGHVSE